MRVGRRVKGTLGHPGEAGDRVWALLEWGFVFCGGSFAVRIVGRPPGVCGHEILCKTDFVIKHLLSRSVFLL